MNQPTVLIVSDDPAFSTSVTSRWHTEREVPAFTLMGGDLCHNLDAGSFDLAIIGGVRTASLSAVIAALNQIDTPVLFAATEGDSVQFKGTVIRQHDGWLDTLFIVASETLRRCEATARARQAEEARDKLERQAALGRYVLEMRHNLNNALTSVLGNAELLLLEPGSLTSSARSQIETIRNMSLRMHEILQRFSSLEKELKVVALQAEKDASGNFRAAAGGA